MHNWNPAINTKVVGYPTELRVVVGVKYGMTDDVNE